MPRGVLVNMTQQYFSSMRGFCNNNNNHHDLFFGSSQVEMESYHESSKNSSTFVRLHQKDNSQQVVQSRNSKLVRAAQELLCEFCSLAGEGSGYDGYDAKKKKKMKKKKEVEEEGVNKDASWNQSFCSMDFMQLQKIKAKLLAMLEEIDKRYTKYCHQMRNVVMPFEAVAGEDAAKVYCSLASEAMSRHFRCLRDGVSGQLRALKRAAGEEDARVDRKSSSAAGTTLGETPRLKLLDQRMRQHKALRQGLQLVEQPPWRLQRGLPDRAVAVLRAWLFEHFLHPYPNDVDKHILARQSGLSKSQVSNWFINARVRLWKPMIEEMYMQEVKVVELQNPNHHSTLEVTMDGQNPNSDLIIFDQKPTAPPRQLVVSDMVRVVDGLDLHPKYSERSRVGSNVSLSLGLQQHSGGGVSLSLLPSSSSSSSLLLLPHIVGHEDQRVQFSILDEEEGERQLPFMNLMGAQLLHDLAR